MLGAFLAGEPVPEYQALVNAAATTELG